MLDKQNFRTFARNWIRNRWCFLKCVFKNTQNSTIIKSFPLQHTLKNGRIFQDRHVCNETKLAWSDGRRVFDVYWYSRDLCDSHIKDRCAADDTLSNAWTTAKNKERSGFCQKRTFLSRVWFLYDIKKFVFVERSWKTIEWISESINRWVHQKWTHLGAFWIIPR